MVADGLEAHCEALNLSGGEVQVVDKRPRGPLCEAAAGSRQRALKRHKRRNLTVKQSNTHTHTYASYPTTWNFVMASARPTGNPSPAKCHVAQ